MSKISKIEISDFRVYRDTQTFSFEQDGKIANLIVIYAPNGYGKTSLFDAVEWVYSDEIARFGRPIIREEIARREFAAGNQILLTNRKSYLEGKEGVVKITIEDGKTVTRKVDVRKISKQEKYHDYRPGIYVSNDFKESDLKSLPHTNLLSQDQIDAFLRYTTPEEKFTALSRFWKEGDDAIKILKDISGYKRVLNNGRIDLYRRRGELEVAVNSLLNAEENITNVNDAIKELSASTALKFKADAVTHPVSDAVYQSLKEVVLSFIKKGQRLVQSAKDQKARLQQLLDSINSFFTNEEEAGKLTERLKLVDGLQKLYVDQNALVKQRAGTQQALSENKQLEGNLERLAGNWTSFQELKAAIVRVQEALVRLLQDNEKLIQMAAVHKQSLNNLEHQRDKWIGDIKSLKAKADSYTDNYRQFTYWNNELVNLQKQVIPLEETHQKKNEQIESLTASRQHWQNISISEDLARLRDSENAEFHEQLDEMQSARQLSNELQVDLQLAQEKFKASGTLDENLERMLLWGENYVNATNTTNCPLCKTEFDDINLLLELIRSEKINVLEIDRQQTEISRLEERIGIQNKRYNNAKDNILAVIREWLALCKETLEKVLEDRDKLTQQLAEIRGKIHHAGEQSEDFGERISLPSFRIDMLANQSPEEIKKVLENKVSELQNNEERLLKLIERKRETWEEFDNLIAVNRNKQASFENDLSINASDDIFKESRSLASDLKISEDETLENIIVRIGKTKMLIDTDQNEFDRLNSQITSLQTIISGYALQVTESELPGQKVRVENETQRINDLVSAFRRLYSVALPQSTIAPQVLDAAREQNAEDIEEITAELERLDQLLVKVELITENINKTKFETQIVDINNKLSQFESAELKLSQAHEAAIDYIDHEINNYFNRDVINQIYSRIEPHPDLNKIEFIPDYAGKNFVVDVRASGSTDTVNPVLYLSAGQLNVLSLSIFLATIFESSDEIISTIFMDDPVQNLSDINILSFIDLIRSMVVNFDKQIVISTHDEHFYKLIQHKIPKDTFDAKYIELSSFGKIKDQ